MNKVVDDDLVKKYPDIVHVAWYERKGFSSSTMLKNITTLKLTEQTKDKTSL